MRELTQTVTAKRDNGWVGNCWQTCVSCILDLDPEVLPPQKDYDQHETNEDGTPGKWVGPKSYYGALQAYLLKHHGLAYVELSGLPSEAHSLIRVSDPRQIHMLTGLTARSKAYNGMRHAVVARGGEMIWDPHPSHAGLTDEVRFAWLIPEPESWKKSRVERGDDPAVCACPACT